MEETRINTGDDIKDINIIPEKSDAGYFSAEKFALWNKIVLDEIKRYRAGLKTTKAEIKYGFGAQYSKEDIYRFLASPYENGKELRDAVRYIYKASTHFRRLIEYFTGLNDFAYIVSPHRIDPKRANPRIINNNYRKVINLMAIMNMKTQFPRILNICLRDGVFFGTIWQTADNITIQQLPTDYCRITTLEGNVLNVTFDFSYFDDKPKMLDYYPEEFRRKYNERYKSLVYPERWIELDCPNSFAITANPDILSYPIPPFAGLLREIYEIEDYRQLKLTKTAIENYALLVMKLPTNDDGDYLIDYNKAYDFWFNLDSVMPDEVGSILTPMDIEKISFERSNVGDTDTVADAENDLFTAAGVSSLLFNNVRASSNALLLSIKVDQAFTYSIVERIEDMVNRYIQSFSFGKNFKVQILDCSRFNSKELGDAYLKAASYGAPTISLYCASQGLNQAELDNMSFLETTVLKLQDMFKPLKNSAQLSSDDIDSETTDEGGAPNKDPDELSDQREANIESGQ